MQIYLIIEMIYLGKFGQSVLMLSLFVCFRRDKLWIAMEYCGGGSMQDIYHSEYYLVVTCHTYITSSIILTPLISGDYFEENNISAIFDNELRFYSEITANIFCML